MGGGARAIRRIDDAVERQVGVRDCGRATLVAIARAYSAPRLDQLDRVPRDREMSLWEMQTWATRAGLSATGLDIQPPNVDALRAFLPCVALCHSTCVTSSERFHYVVFWRLRRHGLIVTDPNHGTYQMPFSRLLTRWTGRIMSFSLDRQRRQPTHFWR